MDRSAMDEARAAIREGIAPTVHRVAAWDKNPLRDCQMITDAALAALSSAGFVIVRREP